MVHLKKTHSRQISSCSQRAGGGTIGIKRGDDRAADGNRAVSGDGLCGLHVFFRRQGADGAAQNLCRAAGHGAGSSGAGRRDRLYGEPSGRRAAACERRCSPAVSGQHGAGDLPVLSVHRHSDGGGDGQAPAAGLAGEGLSGGGGALQFPAADLLHGHPGGQLLLRAVHARALLRRGVLSATVRRAAGGQLEADRHQTKARHRLGAAHRGDGLRPAGTAPHVAHQRHGHCADDAVVLSDAGKPPTSSAQS